jgi:hypothetical protein
MIVTASWMVVVIESRILVVTASWMVVVIVSWIVEMKLAVNGGNTRVPGGGGVLPLR